MDNQETLPALFHALADPTRLAVVEQLVNGPASVSQLSRPFQMADPSFLKHIRVLEDAGVVRTTKQGRVRLVSLAPDVFETVESWVRRHRMEWARKLDTLGDILATRDKETGQ